MPYLYKYYKYNCWTKFRYESLKINWMLMKKLAYFIHNVSLNACQKNCPKGGK
jgi:hypothetical protein